MAHSMNPEQIRHEQFNQDPVLLRDRFRFGMLKELQGLPQWVVWKREVDKEGKQKKAPYNPNHKNAYASVKIPKSWGILQEALTALESGEYSGIGFMLKPPLVLIDLDHSYDRATQTITKPQAIEIMKAIPTYWETSPYTGVHGLVYSDKPIKSLHTDAVEIYGQDRFTTITTDHIAGTPITIEYRTEEIEVLYQRFAPQVEQTSIQNTRWGVESGSTLTELPPEAVYDQLLQQLLRGDITGYASPSNADFVLIMKLLLWTGDNLDLTRQLFLASPLGQREKAQRKTGQTTYVDMTIRNALKKRRNPPQRR